MPSTALTSPTTAPVPGAGQTAPVSSLHMAMVQGAVYDAVNSIDGGHQPYLAGLPPASPAASQAGRRRHGRPPRAGRPRGRARAGAARRWCATASTTLYDDDARRHLRRPGQGPRDRSRSCRCGGDARPPGRTMAATCRSRSSSATTPASGARPRRRCVNDPIRLGGRGSTPFVLREPVAVRVQGATQAHQRRLRQGVQRGQDARRGEQRRAAPEQEAVARFYTNNVNPVELFNRTFRTISETEGLSLVEDARLFAMLNLARRTA